MRCKTAARMVSCSRKFGKASPSSSRPRKACDAPTVYSPKIRVASLSACVSAFIASAASRQATNNPAASSFRISEDTCLYFTAWRAWRFKLESCDSNCAITSSRRERLASAAFSFNSASCLRVCKPVMPAASSKINRLAWGLALIISEIWPWRTSAGEREPVETSANNNCTSRARTSEPLTR